MTLKSKDSPFAGERIAKRLARAGIASRRDAEKIILAGRVAIDGQVISSPAFNVGLDSAITVDGKALVEAEPTRLWRYHKPKGLLTTHRDPEGRPTIFEHLPAGLPRVISVGRLDINSEGLLLLTNDGELARRMELPATGWLRRYRVRIHGTISDSQITALGNGIEVGGIHYGPIEATVDRSQGSNIWLTLGLREGKNREIRRVIEHLGGQVTRLIRTAYGPFQLGMLPPSGVEEIPAKMMQQTFKEGPQKNAASGRTRSSSASKEAGHENRRRKP
ncbi:MAG: pseudouridine synthase [Candidatus Pacebacteria bacterium]|nr:pseudouridine synthase [Candidatus Paceibacterota bacterium]